MLSKDRQVGSMGKFRVTAIFFSLCSVNLFHISIAGDTITPGQSIVDGQTLVSSGGAFELGFFNPGGSKSWYVGIWYKNITVQTVVWVANRDNPLTGSLGSLNLTADGTLSLHNHTGHALWSAGASNMSDPVVQLLDSGNLVLTEGSYDQSKSCVWQSFDHPTDTLLPGMKLGWNLRTNLDRRLTSWTSTSDPSPGDYSSGMNLHGAPDIFIWDGAAPQSRTGPWDGQSWGGSAPLRSNTVLSMQFISTQEEVYYTYEMMDNSITLRLVLDQSGVARYLLWQGQKWQVYWYGPTDQCDQYAHCGPYGICDIGHSPICQCLTGFLPKSQQDLNLIDGSNGCKRRTALDCPGGDGFLKVSGVKLPDTSNATVDENLGIDQCSDRCLKNCSCKAYAFLSGASGCITWFDDLIDIRKLSNGTGEDLYLRLASSEIDANLGKKRRAATVVIITVSIALFISCILAFLFWVRRRKYRAKKTSTEQSAFTFGNGRMIKLGESEERDVEFPLFNFSSIVDATDNFSNANKLGEGGFGPVYKGQLLEGQEIAAKRLAADSGQGLEEFKNEILLVAKLQHRNLVRILGCSIQGEEKILIYEYMANKSLDFFLFDPAKGAQLDWGRRFHIIEGIAQGLLYLHKHSRLRIIHRDLKASNILLDADMNPKISDFGMARIFVSNETQANTKRVVGTYGYMSPEYASAGLFSIKSDVFSYGVLLLEIVSGKRNTGYRGNSFNLLGYAWKLWKEANWLELVDSSLHDKCPMCEISRCIHVALMCVQESAMDRPTMSDVITMLSSESAALLDPKPPAFFNLRISNEGESASSFSENCSLNEVTVTVIDGR